MFVREYYGVDPADSLSEQLYPQFGWRVDEKVAPRQAKEHTTPGPAVTRVGTPARIALAPDNGHPMRGARA